MNSLKMKRSHSCPILVVFLIVIVLIGAFFWYTPVTTVFIVRHAEKEISPLDDPPLSPEGIQRPQTMSHVLADAGINVVFTTQYERTQATVAPTAENLGIVPIIIPAGNTEELLARIKSDHPGDVILVAGHYNTVPEIVEGFGVSPPPVIPDNKFDDLFVVHSRHFIVDHAELMHLKYGRPSP